MKISNNFVVKSEKFSTEFKNIICVETRADLGREERKRKKRKKGKFETNEAREKTERVQ